MNETIHTILSRRTAHDYRPDAVPEALLAEALECAIRAPNHKLTNPWRFTRVGPQAREAIVDLGVSLKDRDGQLSVPQRAKVRAKLASSPELFIIRQVLAEDPGRRREDYGSCACAIQNFALALWSGGVSSKWSTGGVTTHPQTYAIAGIDPAVEEIVGFVWVGFADEQPQTPRRPVPDVLDSIP